MGKLKCSKCGHVETDNSRERMARRMEDDLKRHVTLRIDQGRLPKGVNYAFWTPMNEFRIHWTWFGLAYQQRDIKMLRGNPGIGTISGLTHQWRTVYYIDEPRTTLGIIL